MTRPFNHLMFELLQNNDNCRVIITRKCLAQMVLLSGIFLVISVSFIDAWGVGEHKMLEDREVTDYCALFGEDDIQGKKNMAGNKACYVSDTLVSLGGHETIGLTHPF